MVSIEYISIEVADRARTCIIRQRLTRTSDNGDPKCFRGNPLVLEQASSGLPVFAPFMLAPIYVDVDVDLSFA